MPISILITDDHKMFRQGISKILQEDERFEIIGEAGDGYECLNLINKLKPDVILLDICMPNLDGLQTLSIMKQQKMRSKVIMLTSYKSIDYLIHAMEYECNGYLTKESDVDTLFEAILAVYKGESYVEKSLIPILNEKLIEKDSTDIKVADLTSRELEVLVLIANGLFNKEIAATLNISERTVKNHVSNIFRKIEVSDRTQAAVFAIKNNIVEIK
jgi:DNA-binding NarL/FixJ family response regulator